MKPISDAVANAMPEAHALFVEWIQSSREASAAILQGRSDLVAAIETSNQKLDLYLYAVRKFQREQNAHFVARIWRVRHSPPTQLADDERRH